MEQQSHQVPSSPGDAFNEGGKPSKGSPQHPPPPLPTAPHNTGGTASVTSGASASAHSSASSHTGSHTSSSNSGGLGSAQSVLAQSSYVKHLEKELETLREERGTMLQTVLDLKKENEENAQVGR